MVCGTPSRIRTDTHKAGDFKSPVYYQISPWGHWRSWIGLEPTSVFRLRLTLITIQERLRLATKNSERLFSAASTNFATTAFGTDVQAIRIFWWRWWDSNLLTRKNGFTVRRDSPTSPHLQKNNPTSTIPVAGSAYAVRYFYQGCLVPHVGIELTTYWLQSSCSTTELEGQGAFEHCQVEAAGLLAFIHRWFLKLSGATGMAVSQTRVSTRIPILACIM